MLLGSGVRAAYIALHLVDYSSEKCGHFVSRFWRFLIALGVTLLDPKLKFNAREML